MPLPYISNHKVLLGAPVAAFAAYTLSQDQQNR